MSPNVGNFVHDLVEMAKAMETLPQVQAELERANGSIEYYAKQVQELEMNAINRKAEIDRLHDRIRSLEVERDDASFRVLEAEDATMAAIRAFRHIVDEAEGCIRVIDPPKPEPVKEPEPQAQPVATPAQEDTSRPLDASLMASGDGSTLGVNSIEEGSPGQSESSPSVETASGQSPVADQASVSAPEPAHGPYSGKRYYDILDYIPRSEWLAGGGTEADYNWRPDRSSF